MLFKVMFDVYCVKWVKIYYDGFDGFMRFMFIVILEDLLEDYEEDEILVEEVCRMFRKIVR